MFHRIFSEIVCAHLSTVWRQGAGWRSYIRCVRPGSRAPRIGMLGPSQPQLRAATVRVRLHLPARDQVGLQAWRDRNREREEDVTGRSVHSQMKLEQAWVGFSHPCVDEGIGGCFRIQQRLSAWQDEFPQWIILAGSGMKLESREGEAVNINLSQLQKPRSYTWAILVSITISKYDVWCICAGFYMFFSLV